VLWDQVLLPALHARPSDRCAIKLLKLHEGHAIRVVAVFDKFLVTAATDGFVRFYDFKFRLLAWYEDLDVGSITRLTFTSPRAPMDKMAVESEVCEARIQAQIGRCRDLRRPRCSDRFRGG